MRYNITNRNGEEKELVVDVAFAKKVLKIVDKGLVNGIGSPKPGHMCVEAAVAFASGEDHNDKPTCVDEDLSGIKIDLNDQLGWSSNKARARGLRRLAIAQLGSVGKFDAEVFFSTIRKLLLPEANKQLANEKERIIKKIKSAKDWSDLFELEQDEYGAAMPDVMDVDDIVLFFEKLNGAKKKAPSREFSLMQTAEVMVQALIKMKMPGTKFLHLANPKKRAKR